MKSIHMLTLTALFTITIHAVKSQSDPSIRPENISMSSPNAASLGKVADIPVNFHTGIPNIEIPVYVIEEGPLKLPISLIYHASGLKVMETASWVGAGWSLNAGGMITRTVRGGADEKRYYAADFEPNAKSYLLDSGYYNYLFKNGVVGPDYNWFTPDYKDGEPDLFTFNFNGYTGKFAFRPDRTAAFFPQQDIRVEPLLCVNNTGCTNGWEDLYGFIMTTPDGVRYYFGKTISVTSDVDALERTAVNSINGPQSFANIVSSWFLYKMESPDRKFHIDLTYTPEKYSVYTPSLYPVDASRSTAGIRLLKNYMNGIQLSRITFSNGTVDFIPGDQPRKDLSSDVGIPGYFYDLQNTSAKPLRKISISNKAGSFCKAFLFGYSYFNDTSGQLPPTMGGENLVPYGINADKMLLKLNSVREQNCSGSIKLPPHEFSYYDSTLVPRRLSMAQDHWGYFNGKTTNKDLTPPLSRDGGYTIFSGTADRESSWPSMRAGALSQITYPTGGYTRFVYQPNDAYMVRSGIDSSLVLSFQANLYYRVPAANCTNHTPSCGFFLVTTPSKFRIRISYPYETTQNGNTFRNQGSAYIVDAQGNSMNVPANGSLFTLYNPGYYQFYVQSIPPAGVQGIDPYAIQASLFRYSVSQTAGNIMVGGLRIDSLITSDGGVSPPMIKKFNYESTENKSYGVLFGRPTYIAKMRSDFIQQFGFGIHQQATDVIALPSDGCSRWDAVNINYHISAASLLPLRTTQGSHIGYNQVKVTGNNGGYTIYKYTNFQNISADVSNRIINWGFCDSYSPTYPPRPDMPDYSRGELINESVFNAAGDLRLEKIYNTTFQEEPHGVRGLISKLSVSEHLYFITEYELKSAKRTYQSVRTLNYDDASPQKKPVETLSEIWFQNPSHTLPTLSVIKDPGVSGVIYQTTKTAYPHDLNFSSLLNANNCDQQLTNDLTSVQIHAAAASNQSNSFINRLKSFNSYQLLANQARVKHRQCRRNSAVNQHVNLNNYVTSGTPIALVGLINNHQINAPIEQVISTGEGLVQSTYLSYRDMAGDGLSIYPDSSKSIMKQTATPGYIDQPSAISVSPGVVKKDSRYQTEDTYKYINGRLVEFLSRDGLITAYLYDSTFNYPIAKAVGVNYNTLSMAFTAAGKNPDALRNQPMLNGIPVNTYTYIPLVGVSAETDPNKLTTYYSYDDLGRLLLIQDTDKKIVKKIYYHYKNGTNANLN